MNRNQFLRSAGLLTAGFMWPIERLFASSNRGSANLWPELLEYARWCPSPHNVQCWKLKILDEKRASLYYDPKRIPVIVDSDTSFTIVGMGMFIECLNIAAQSKGWQVQALHEQEGKLNSKAVSDQLFAQLELVPFNGKPICDRDLILKRRTSRLHYDGRQIPDFLIMDLAMNSALFGQHLNVSSDPELVHSIIELNSNVILERADDVPTMEEMRHWIRTNDAEAAEKKDGLWSAANAVSGKLLYNFCYHHERFVHGWKRGMTRKMMNKGMKGTPQMGWIKGPFAKRTDWVNAGIMLQRLWLAMTSQGIYLHPLGTIITTPSAKETFLKKINTTDEHGIVWFLIRLGYSKEPVRSYRLEAKDLLIP